MDNPLSQERLKGTVVTPTDIAMDHLKNSVSIAEMLGNKTAIAQTDQLKVVLSEVKRLQAIEAENKALRESLANGHDMIISLEAERDRYKTALQHAGRIIDSGMGAGILRYDPVQWFIDTHEMRNGADTNE